MRITFKIMFFIICLNLASGMVYALDVPGVAYASMPMGQYQNATHYEERFNATNLIADWSDNALKDIPFLGHIISGATLMFNALKFLIWGFPDTLDQFAGLIGSASGRSAFFVIVNVLRALFALVTAIFVIEFITGREITD